MFRLSAFALLFCACTGDKDTTATDVDGDADTDADADSDADTDTTTPTTTTTSTTTTSTTTTLEPFVLSSPDMDVHTAGPCYQQLPQFAECVNFGGDNVNPELVWSGVPAGTVSLALLFDDVVYTPGNDPFDHWGAYNLDPTTGGLPQASSGDNPTSPFPTGAEQIYDYNGSCSNSNNTYRWRLVALDAAFPGTVRNLAEIEAFAADHGLALATMCHCPEDDCVYY